MPDNCDIKLLLHAVVVENSETAYKQLFLLMYERLYHFSFSIVKSAEEAEEIVSDVFMKIWEKREILLRVNAPKFYFYTMTKNFSINKLKQMKKDSHFSIDKWALQLHSYTFNPEELVVSQEGTIRISQAISDLPPKCKLIFKLVKEDGLKYKEVAELLHLSVKTIEAQMAIALRKIASFLKIDLETSPNLTQKKIS